MDLFKSAYAMAKAYLDSLPECPFKTITDRAEREQYLAKLSIPATMWDETLAAYDAGRFTIPELEDRIKSLSKTFVRAAVIENLEADKGVSVGAVRPIGAVDNFRTQTRVFEPFKPQVKQAEYVVPGKAVSDSDG